MKGCFFFFFLFRFPSLSKSLMAPFVFLLEVECRHSNLVKLSILVIGVPEKRAFAGCWKSKSPL